MLIFIPFKSFKNTVIKNFYSFRRLNAELEAKTEKLVRQAEELMVSKLCRL